MRWCCFVACVFAMVCQHAAAEEPAVAATEPLPEGAVRRFGSPRLRHHDDARGVCYTPDGTRIVSCGDDSAVRIWDAKTGRQLREFRSPNENDREFGGLAMTPDGKFVIAGTSRLFDSGQLLVWNFATGRCVATMKANSKWLRDVACSPDGRFVASAGGDGRALVFDLAKRTRVHTFATGGTTYDIDFSADSRYLATASQGGAIEWDLSTGKRRRTIKPPDKKSGDPSGIAYSPDGQYLAVSWWMAQVGIYSAKTGRLKHVLQRGGRRGDAIGWSPDSSRFVTADFQSNVVLWDTQTFKELRRTKGYGQWYCSVTFSPDGRSIAGASESVHVFDAATLEEPLATPGHVQRVSALAVASSGNLLASGAGLAPVFLWDLSSGKLAGKLGRPSYGVESLDFAPGRPYLAVGYAHHGLGVWDLSTRKIVVRKEGTKNSSQYVRFAPDGSRVAWSSGPMIRIVQIPSGEQTHGLHHRSKLTQNGNQGRLVFVPNGDLLAYLDDGTVRRWHDAKQTIVLRLGAPRLYASVLSPGGRWLSTGDYRKVRLWSLDGKETVREAAISNHEPSLSLAFSPTGAFALAGDRDGNLALWEVATLRVCAEWDSTQGYCAAAAFLPDGRHLVTAGRDTTILVWDLAAVQGALQPANDAAQARKLVRLLKNEDPVQAFSAIGALARSGRVALAPLRAAATKKHKFATLRALTALDLLGSEAALTIVEAVAKRSRDAGVKIAAKEVLKRHAQLER